MSLAYRISLGLTILLTLAAFVFLLGWFGTLIKSAGSLSLSTILPWYTLGLLALAAINCTLRKRLIVWRM